MDTELHIKNWLSAFWYNRSDKEMKSLCEEIKSRLAKYNCNHTSDGDVLYSIIITEFGEYGTSPRSGWLLNIKPEVIIDIITNFESEYIDEKND